MIKIKKTPHRFTAAGGFTAFSQKAKLSCEGTPLLKV
jgi:hypothetical protein